VIDLPIGPHPSREKGYREKQVVRHDEQGRPALTIWRVREWYAGIERAPTATAAAPTTASAQPKPPPKVGPGWAPAPEVSRPAAPGSPQLPPPKAPDRDYTLVELELRTGRTHQIRVHLSHHGYPIVGDDMYGGRPLSASAKAEPLIDRQALHAALLGFTHPITGEPMRFTAPVRGDMARAIAHLRGTLRVQSPGMNGTLIDLASAIPPG
ncbi:MAG: pseudouridine synthase, partial [Planctomycetota bacterium]|nr:pseudouridine synthase [Planctomycetota bacterium]